ncbi:MAG TPA: metallophosphoesterase [Actinomycetota bacterium]|nr:metallophosphoesterase [Actinomycetota bacterium]
MRTRATALVALALGACSNVPPADGPSNRVAGATGNAVVAIVGDAGTGGSVQRNVAAEMCRLQERLGFEVVATTGDNIYPEGSPDDFATKFVRPYRCLLTRGVRFRASLGNHDVLTDGGDQMIATRPFGMRNRYYAFAAGSALFVVLDSTNLDDEQLAWLDRRLHELSGAPWLIVLLHHPPYSGGAEHGSDTAVRAALEPRFDAAGVDLVLSGHDHVYSRAEASGITYVVTGGGGARLYPCSQEPPAEVVTCRSAHHFVVLKVSETTLRVRSIGLGGEILDRVRLTRSPS